MQVLRVARSAREDDEDGYDGDDDYLPMLDPLAWNVRYEACPRDVCVTRGLRAAVRPGLIGKVTLYNSDES